jgi:hypothetical protein
MALTIDTTWGTVTANSYCSVQESIDYHARRYHTTETWTDVSSTDKTSLLVWATSLIDQLFKWDGNKVLQSQALQCPRYGLYDINSWPIDMVTKPAWIADATAEYAYRLYQSDLVAQYDSDQSSAGSSDLEGFKEITVGPITLKSSIGESSKELNSITTMIPTSVLLILKPYGTIFTSRQRRIYR